MTISRLSTIDTRAWPMPLRARIAAALHFDATTDIGVTEIDAARRFAASCSWFYSIDAARGEAVPTDAEVARQVAELIHDADPLGGVVMDGRSEWTVFAGSLAVIDELRGSGVQS